MKRPAPRRYVFGFVSFYCRLDWLEDFTMGTRPACTRSCHSAHRSFSRVLMRLSHACARAKQEKRSHFTKKPGSLDDVEVCAPPT